MAELHNEDTLANLYKGKRVAVTGAAGSVGAEIVDQLIKFDIASLTLLDNNETELFHIEQKYANDHRVIAYLADVRDADKLTALFTGVDYIIHAAAYKHVPLCERSTELAVAVNVTGAQNVVRAACMANADKVLLTSSDKAVNPTNVMGSTKLLSERIFTSSHFLKPVPARTKFGSTRFGNVVGSRGSVVPLFERQIKAGGPVTVTDPEMTRFMMSVKQAASLVLQSIDVITCGEVVVTKMPVFRIIDLAEVMIEKLAPVYGFKSSDITINVIGRRAGEKVYEELTTEEEVIRARDIGEFIVVSGHPTLFRNAPAGKWADAGTALESNYISATQPFASKAEISDYLIEWGIFNV